MKALENNNLAPNKINAETIQFVHPELTEDIRIVDYHEMPEKGQLIISLYSRMFAENKINVFMRDNRIVLFITEKMQAGQSTELYISDWQNFYPRSYLRMRHVSLMLPGDNFYLLRHILIPDEFMLKIILGQDASN